MSPESGSGKSESERWVMPTANTDKLPPPPLPALPPLGLKRPKIQRPYAGQLEEQCCIYFALALTLFVITIMTLLNSHIS